MYEKNKYNEKKQEIYKRYLSTVPSLHTNCHQTQEP